MAILVSNEGELLRCTLRWNHVIEPKYAKPGREVDKAFISYAELSQVTGLDVEAEVKKELSDLLDKTKDLPKGKKVYEGPEGICFASDRLQWYDRDLRKIDPPEEIGGFNCSDTNITSLEGCPKIVNDYFNCSYTSITSLEGCPEIVNGGFDCSDTDITSLEGCPREVGGTFCCSYTRITSLKSAPRKVGGGFYCSNTDITSLEGSPEEVRGSFWCNYTKITSLEGCPEKVGGNFDCSYTSITSLEGCPKEVRDGFNCSGTKITSLKGAPAKIGDFDYYRFSASISIQQLDAYKDWLETNPK